MTKTKLSKNVRHPAALASVRYVRSKKEMCIRGPDGHVRTGLTKMLKLKCWPRYRYELAKRIDPTIPMPDKLESEETKEEREERRESEQADTRYHKSVKGGTRVGNGLDQAISDCVKVLDGYSKLPLEAFTNPKLAEEQASKLPYELRPVLIRLAKRKNPYFAMFIGWCIKNKCVPVAAQLPLTYGKIGTMADVIVKYESGVHRVVEIKTGCMNYLNKYFSKMILNVLANFTDCVLNQHYLQVMCTQIMYESQFNFIKTAIPVVLYFTVAGVHEYAVPQMGIGLFKPVLESLLRNVELGKSE